MEFLQKLNLNAQLSYEPDKAKYSNVSVLTGRIENCWKETTEFTVLAKQSTRELLIFPVHITHQGVFQNTNNQELKVKARKSFHW